MATAQIHGFDKSTRQKQKSKSIKKANLPNNKIHQIRQ